MAEIRIDSAPWSPPSSPATVSDGFEAARQQVRERGRVVVTVQLDGKELVWNDGSPEWDRPLVEFQSLVLSTQDPRDLSLPLLEGAGAALVEAAAAHRDAAATLRGGITGEGIQKTVDAIAIWKDLHELINGVIILHSIDLSSPGWSQDGALLESLTERSTQRLTELREAFDTHDLVLVADLLDYELAPLAEEWQHFLSRLRSTLERPLSMEGDSSWSPGPAS